MRYVFSWVFLLISSQWVCASRCEQVNDSQGNYTVSCPNYVDNPNLYDNKYKKKKHRRYRD